MADRRHFHKSKNRHICAAAWPIAMMTHTDLLNRAHSYGRPIGQAIKFSSRGFYLSSSSSFFLAYSQRSHWKKCNITLIEADSPNFPNITLIYDRIAEIAAFYRKSGSRYTMLTSDFRPEVEMTRFAHAHWKMYNITTVYDRIAEIPNLYWKSGS